MPGRSQAQKAPWRRRRTPTAGFLLENPMDGGAWRATSTACLRLDQVPGERGEEEEKDDLHASNRKTPGLRWRLQRFRSCPPQTRRHAPSPPGNGAAGWVTEGHQQGFLESPAPLKTTVLFTRNFTQKSQRGQRQGSQGPWFLLCQHFGSLSFSFLFHGQSLNVSWPR